MKPPPFLLGAALLFWGWQSGFLLAGAVMAVVLEGARLVKTRWEFSDDDFSRVWTFCTLVFLAAGVYAFTANDGPSTFGGFFQNPNPLTQRRAGTTSARTGAAMLRWLPMILFPFIAAQTYSTRETIRLSTVSLILRWQARRARQAGQPSPAERNVHVGYPYFGVCLLAACVHAADENLYNSFFWGLCALLAWALWAQRSRRFALAVWATALVAAITLGFLGQRGIGELRRYLEDLSPQWFARFVRRGVGVDPAQSRTALGQVGELKMSGRIVIRLEPREGSPVPTYLREASYRAYRSPVWFAGSSKDDFTGVVEDAPNSGGWNLLPTKISTNAVNIACYLEGVKNSVPAGLLPLPTGSSRLEKLPAYVLEKNSAGAVLAQAPRLVMFDAFFGPGATMDLPPGSSGADDEDLGVPETEWPALDTVIENLQLRGRPLPQVLSTLAGHFADQFAYSTWQRPLLVRGTNETPLSRFLLKTRSGHCEYFATATVLLLRRLEIPARYAVGYAVHEASGKKYVVRQRDAHAWCLVWDAEKQVWQDFDTTPASWIERESERASPAQWLADLWSRIGFEFAKLRYGQSQVRQYVLWVMLPVLALLLYQILFRRGRQRRAAKGSDEELWRDWPGLDSEFYRLERKLAERGLSRGGSEPLNDWLERVAGRPELMELREPLRELLRLHYRYRFDPLGLNAEDRQALRREAKACLERLSVRETAAAAREG